MSIVIMFLNAELNLLFVSVYSLALGRAMSRGRKRKTDKGTFSEDSMKQAVEAVLKGDINGRKVSLREAALQYHVKYQTLFRYVKKSRENPNVPIRMTPNYQCRLVFSQEQETSLKAYMITCSKMCYGKSTKDFRELAYEMAKINKIKTPDSWEDKKRAGIDWMQGFLKRHPQISIRQPEGCSISRATSFNRHNVSIFFENLAEIYRRSDKFADGCRIFNLDETATTTVQKPKKVLAPRGQKQVSQCTSGERGTLVTTCCIISASGNSLPPVMVFPRKHFKTHMINGAPIGTLGLVSTTGWMTSELFPSVMRHFISHSNSSKDNPSVLIYDNHESHLTIATLNLAKNSGVTIVTLPPHCSNKLQPLDVSVFYSFKSHYNAAADSWLLHHPGTPLSIYEVASCVGVAHQRAMTPANIISGFKKTGIYPFDRDVFSDDDFLVSYVTDRDFPAEAREVMETEPIVTTSKEKEFRTPPKEIPQTEGELNSLDVEGSPTENVAPTPSPGTCAVPSNPFISPEQHKGFPKAGARKFKKPRTKGRSCIATDTPEKSLFEAKETEKQRKISLKKSSLSRKKKPIISDLSSSEDEVAASSPTEEDSDEDIEWPPALDPSGFEELDREPILGDFVLVLFETKIAVFYIGQVAKEKDLENDIEINFLRKSLKDERHFVFPVVPDVASVSLDDIKMILPTPTCLGKTKRLQSSFKFELDFTSLNIR